ncbi:MAG TPA: D-arabinono-1,4-lactone oxidase [Micromonosporaceae bacterium]|jgi:alditol oxidase
MALTNWAGNVAFRPRQLHRPSSVEQLRRIVAGGDRVRALGTGHSFNRLADTGGDLVSLAGLPPMMDIDTTRMAVRVAAGVRYGELATYLEGHGCALRNLASLPHISVAGACATGTHGSGVGNGSLATAVSALTMVTADGDLVTLDRADRRFPGAVVALGALGIVTSLTVDVVPSFEMEQHVYEDLPRGRIDTDFDEIMSGAYSVSLFTDWSGPDVTQVWLKCLAGTFVAERDWFGATRADGPRHPIRGGSAANCTEQLGVPGPWHERLPHFRLEFTPSSGDELQSEYAVPRDRAVEALATLDGIRARIAPVLQVSEIRTVAADDLWLSPFYGRDSVTVHFTWLPDAAAVQPVVGLIEDRLAPFAARPHWGKVFDMRPAVLAGVYERLPDFAGLMRAYDPRGTFRNDLIDRWSPPASAPRG